MPRIRRILGMATKWENRGKLFALPNEYDNLDKLQAPVSKSLVVPPTLFSMAKTFSAPSPPLRLFVGVKLHLAPLPLPCRFVAPPSSP